VKTGRLAAPAWGRWGSFCRVFCGHRPRRFACFLVFWLGAYGTASCPGWGARRRGRLAVAIARLRGRCRAVQAGPVYSAAERTVPEEC